MVEQLQGPFEKFIDWWQFATVMLLCPPLHNSSMLPPVHELFKRPLHMQVMVVMMMMMMIIIIIIIIIILFHCCSAYEIWHGES
jgi:hypothetical protein